MRSLLKPRKTGESGFILVWVLVMVLLITISLAIAAPKIAVEVQRDKEAEYYHRGQQYARAIRLFYNKTGHFPTDIAQLEKSNDTRFLRKRYRDPITGAADWHLIHQGESKTQLMGLFGQPYTTVTAGPIPGGLAPGTQIGLVAVNQSTASNGGLGAGASGGFGGNSFSNSSGFSSTNSFSNSSSGFGATQNSTFSAGGANATSDAHASTDPVSVAPIVGVSSVSKKPSIRIYKRQTHYNEWEFVYNPAEDGIGGGVQPGLNTPGIVSGPATGAPSGVTVDPSLSSSSSQPPQQPSQE